MIKMNVYASYEELQAIQTQEYVCIFSQPEFLDIYM